MIFDRFKNLFAGKNKNSDNDELSDLFEEGKDAENDIESEKGEAVQAASEENTMENDLAELENIAKDLNIDSVMGEFSQADEEQKEEESDINKAINELLREDAETEVVDVNYNYINDISVYDTVRKDKDKVFEEISEEMEGYASHTAEASKSFVVLMAIAAALLVLVLISASALFVVINKSGGINTITEEAEPAYVASQTSFTSNIANYIFLKQEKNLGDVKLNLSKMLADPMATVFYFENSLNTQKYNFVLTDNSGKLYSMDLYFVENNKEDTDDNSAETVIRFEPLTAGVKSVNLSVRDNETGEIADFKIVFEEKLKMLPVNYLKEPVEVSNDDFNARITNVTLASSGSSIEYYISGAEDKEYTITQGLKSNSNFINFEEGSTNLPKKKDLPEAYTFDEEGGILGRMDFGSVRNTNGNYYITLTDIYKKYNTGARVNASAVTSNSEVKTQTVDIDNYRIVFEGLAAYNDCFVFVFHAEDKNIAYDPKNPMANRIEAIIDAQLVGTTSTGMEVVLDGKCTAAQQGTDMIFPVSEYARDFIYGVSREDLRVDIKSVLIKMDDVKIPLNYSQFRDTLSSERESFNNSVVNAFEARLKYKSDRASLSAITGFSDDVLKDEILMSDYQPIKDTDTSPNFSAQVISANIDGDTALAIVQDTWIGLEGNTEIHFYRKHRVKAEKTKLGWQITEDEIIQ